MTDEKTMRLPVKVIHYDGSLNSAVQVEQALKDADIIYSQFRYSPTSAPTFRIFLDHSSYDFETLDPDDYLVIDKSDMLRAPAVVLSEEWEKELLG